MKRLLASAAVTPLALLALGGPAVAAQPEPKPQHTTDIATYAHAEWMYESEGLYVEGGLSAVDTRNGPVLVLEQGAYSEGGAWTRTFIPEDEQVSFDLTMDRARLTAAQLHADDVPVQVCTYEAQGDEDPDCVPSTVDVSLTWTGDGPITRSGDSSHYADGTMRINTHGNYTSREATVLGSVTGAVDVDDFAASWMVRSRYIEIKRCISDTPCEEPEE